MGNSETEFKVNLQLECVECNNRREWTHDTYVVENTGELIKIDCPTCGRETSQKIIDVLAVCRDSI